MEMAWVFAHFLCAKALFAGIGNGYLLFCRQTPLSAGFYFSAPAAIPKFEGGEDRQQTKAGSPGQTYAARGRAIS